MPSGTPRRLTKAARRRQLVSAALPLAARQGLAAFSLEDLAARAGVTRNLVYHYFPRGRLDVVVAVVEEAERQLSPPETRDNPLTAMIDHALAPTHAWLIHRMAAGETDPQVRATVALSAEQRTRALRQTNLAPNDPPQAIADASLRGYLSFAEAALDRGRALGLPRTELARLLEQMLVASIDAARR